jgi:hypothetical protein
MPTHPHLVAVKASPSVTPENNRSLRCWTFEQYNERFRRFAWPDDPLSWRTEVAVRAG